MPASPSGTGAMEPFKPYIVEKPRRERGYQHGIDVMRCYVVEVRHRRARPLS
jgi:hypothetical protein